MFAPVTGDGEAETVIVTVGVGLVVEVGTDVEVGVGVVMVEVVGVEAGEDVVGREYPYATKPTRKRITTARGIMTLFIRTR